MTPTGSESHSVTERHTNRRGRETQMKEGSIGLFTREVQAIFGGLMTCLLRPIDPQMFYDDASSRFRWKGRTYSNPQDVIEDSAYLPGHKLWVGEMSFITPADMTAPDGNVVDSSGRKRLVGYAADLDDVQMDEMLALGARKKTWTNMPRWASRFSLMITSSRIIRLHTVTEKNAIGLGFVSSDGGADMHTLRAYWDAEFSARGLGWPVNPWVRLDDFTPVYSQQAATAAVS